MATGTATTLAPREDRTIILAIPQEEYEQIAVSPPKFRAWLDEHDRLNPEIFPATFEKGYKLHNKTTSDKTSVLKQRIKLRNGQVWTIHPGFVMPRMPRRTTQRKTLRRQLARKPPSRSLRRTKKKKAAT